MRGPGNSMMPVVLVFFAILGVMTFAFDSEIKRRDNPNLSIANADAALGDGPVSVELRRNRFGRYMAPGTINGQPVTFLVDTGADNIAVPREVGERLRLPRLRDSMAMTAGGTVPSYDTQLNEVAIGGLRLRNVAGSVVPAMGGDAVLLGMSFLRHVNFRQEGDRLIIEAPTTR